MPRRPRVILPDVPLHVIQRGNNRQACFFADKDYRFYLEWLAEYAAKSGCLIHAYALMTNHVHLLVSGNSAGSVGGLMKALGQRYVQYVNRMYRRSGTLWEGRFRSCLGEIDAIRQAKNGNFVLGNDCFSEQVARMVGRRVVRGKSGRPLKIAQAESLALEL